MLSPRQARQASRTLHTASTPHHHHQVCHSGYVYGWTPDPPNIRQLG